VPAGGTPNSKKSKKKKKNNNESTPPNMVNPMLAMTSGVSPRGIDTYHLPPTMVNQQMSLPIIKSDISEADPKVSDRRKTERFFHQFVNLFSANVVDPRNLKPMDPHL
jgi:hypothetical protein